MSDTTVITKPYIHAHWKKHQLRSKLSTILGHDVKLKQDRMHCIKDTYKSSIWSLNLKTQHGSLPVVLKMFKRLNKKRKQSIVEQKIYLASHPLLQPYMPTIYWANKRIGNEDCWVIMEQLHPLNEQINIARDFFDRIIPRLAALHAATYHQRMIHRSIRDWDWLPVYDSRTMVKQRLKIQREFKDLLETAMRDRKLQSLVRPHYRTIHKLLDKGPHYCPEVKHAGQCIIHSDLQLPNMATALSAATNPEEWTRLKFIDWEGARYAPCWLDLVNLVGVYLAYRQDFREQEPVLAGQYARQYATEMNKNGIHFELEPYLLYKFAFLQHLLEKGAYLQLKWAITGVKKPRLLQVYLSKLGEYGEEYMQYIK